LYCKFWWNIISLTATCSFAKIVKLGNYCLFSENTSNSKRTNNVLLISPLFKSREKKVSTMKINVMRTFIYCFGVDFLAFGSGGEMKGAFYYCCFKVRAQCNKFEHFFLRAANITDNYTRQNANMIAHCNKSQ